MRWHYIRAVSGLTRKPGDGGRAPARRFAQRPPCDSIPFSAATRGGPKMKPALALLLAALAAALALPASPAYGQIGLTEETPPDGAHLNAPPHPAHLRF